MKTENFFIIVAVVLVCLLALAFLGVYEIQTTGYKAWVRATGNPHNFTQREWEILCGKGVIRLEETKMP